MSHVRDMSHAPVDEYERRLGLWIAALESGEFEHGISALHSRGTYCCLGVACEVYRRETGDGEWGLRHVQSPRKWFTVAGVSSDLMLPEPVQKWFGLWDGRGQFGEENVTLLGPTTSLPIQAPGSLTGINDHSSGGYQNVVKWIKARPRGLFTWTERGATVADEQG